MECRGQMANRYVTKPGELKSLLFFCTHNNLKSATVTSVDEDEDVQLENILLKFMPAAIYAYSIGLHTMFDKATH